MEMSGVLQMGLARGAKRGMFYLEEILGLNNGWKHSFSGGRIYCNILMKASLVMGYT